MVGETQILRQRRAIRPSYACIIVRDLPSYIVVCLVDVRVYDYELGKQKNQAVAAGCLPNHEGGMCKGEAIKDGLRRYLLTGILKTRDPE